MQSRAYSALHDALSEDAIPASSISIQADGVVAIQFEGTCSAVLPTIRQHISALAAELANTVTSAQLNEINGNWREASRREMPLSPLPVVR
jgi:hypothetical protein